jgi:uncharacterized protein (TIGR04255 family)
VSSPSEPLEHLTEPPIAEVVCGVKFADLAGLDPVLIGAYWHERREEFPERQLHEALQDPHEVVWSSSPLVRVWLMTRDGEFLLQMQHDRFYLNWRRIGAGTYPRFNDRDDQRGVLTRTLSEFETFSSFCERALDARPRPLRCELTKIDHLVEGRHWSDLDDLSRMLPWLRTFAAFARSEAPTVAVQFSEQRDGGHLHVSLRVPTRASAGRRVVVMETRVIRELVPGSDLRSVFVSANAETNGVFSQLIPSAERVRFTRGTEGA